MTSITSSPLMENLFSHFEPNKQRPLSLTSLTAICLEYLYDSRSQPFRPLIWVTSCILVHLFCCSTAQIFYARHFNSTRPSNTTKGYEILEVTLSEDSVAILIKIKSFQTKQETYCKLIRTDSDSMLFMFLNFISLLSGSSEVFMLIYTSWKIPEGTWIALKNRVKLLVPSTPKWNRFTLLLFVFCHVCQREKLLWCRENKTEFKK